MNHVGINLKLIVWKNKKQNMVFEFVNLYYFQTFFLQTIETKKNKIQ